MKLRDVENLGFGDEYARSINCDPNEFDESTGERRYRIIAYGPQTLDEYRQFDSDYGTCIVEHEAEQLDRADYEDADAYEEDLLTACHENFNGGDLWIEHEERNAPMMNYLWPVTPMDSEETCARLMEQHAGAVSLVCDDDAGQYYIALTGGGMDLSPSLMAGYICCGCLPPLSLVEMYQTSYTTASAEITAMFEPAARRIVEGVTARLKRRFEKADA